MRGVITSMKRVFGAIEALFDIVYILTGTFIATLLTINASNNIERMLSGIMAIVLIGGDVFHLLPRIMLIITGNEEQLRGKLGRGKQITSITMTIFYILLWHIGLLIFSLNTMTVWTLIIYVLALIRIFICLLPQNRWQDRYPPVVWGMWRNIPFFLVGVFVSCLFFFYRSSIAGFGLMWLAIVLSFSFYFPVVFFANKNPKIGMLMLPKTCCYVWMLIMCMSL